MASIQRSMSARDVPSGRVLSQVADVAGILPTPDMLSPVAFRPEARSLDDAVIGAALFLKGARVSLALSSNDGLLFVDTTALRAVLRSGRRAREIREGIEWATLVEWMALDGHRVAQIYWLGWPKIEYEIF